MNAHRGADLYYSYKTFDTMKFKKVKVKVGFGKEKVEKFKAQMVKGQAVSFDKLAEMIELSSNLSKGDILSVLYMMRRQAVFLLQEGHAVRFDELGTLTPSASVKTVDTADDVKTETIKKVSARFTPAKELKKAMNDVSRNIESE